MRASRAFHPSNKRLKETKITVPANVCQKIPLIFSLLVPPRWILPPTDVKVMLGRSVSLDCLVSGTPRPSIKWSVADEKVPGKFHEIQNVMKDFR